MSVSTRYDTLYMRNPLVCGTGVHISKCYVKYIDILKCTISMLRTRRLGDQGPGPLYCRTLLASSDTYSIATRPALTRLATPERAQKAPRFTSLRRIREAFKPRPHPDVAHDKVIAYDGHVIVMIGVN